MVPQGERKALPLTASDPLVKWSKKGAWQELEAAIQDASGAADGRAAYVNRTDHNGSTALFHAAWWGHTSCIEVLLLAGCDANWQNTRRNTALHLACERYPVLPKQQKAIIKLLIAHGARIAVPNMDAKGFCYTVIDNDQKALELATYLLHCTKGW